MKNAANILAGGIIVLAVAVVFGTTAGCDRHGRHMSYRRYHRPAPRRSYHRGYRSHRSSGHRRSSGYHRSPRHRGSRSHRGGRCR